MSTKTKFINFLKSVRDFFTGYVSIIDEDFDKLIEVLQPMAVHTKPDLTGSEQSTQI